MADTLEFDEMPIADDASLALNDMEKKQIIHALEQAKGNRKLAAALCRLPDSFMCAHFNPSVTT